MEENLSAATMNMWATQARVLDWALAVEDYEYATHTCAPGNVMGQKPYQRAP